MKIKELLLDDKPSISFEVFPPKTSTVFENVKKATLEVAKLRPSFVSVTYGAGGGTSKYTLDIAKAIHDQYNVPTLAHLTCVSSSKETIHQQMVAIKEAGIENVMALRGDIPENRLTEDRSHWDFQHAVQLVRSLKEFDPEFCIGGACYPEIHPESPDQKTDIFYLKEKVDAGCDFLTTQMFFDNNLLYNYLYKIREQGITVPILPGIMPITNQKQVSRAIKLSGCFMPQRFKSLVDHFGRDPKAMKEAGIIYACDQIIDLFANGISHVHVYSMNQPEVAGAILQNLSAILH